MITCEEHKGAVMFKGSGSGDGSRNSAHSLTGSALSEHGGPITLTDIALDDLSVLAEQTTAAKQKQEIQDRLAYIFSSKRDKGYHKSSLEILEPRLIELTRNLRLVQLIKSVAENLLSERELFFEHFFHIFLIQVASQLIRPFSIQDKESTTAASDVSDIIMNLLGPADTPDALILLNYFKDKIKKIKLEDLLSHKTQEQLNEIISDIESSRIARETRFSNMVKKIIAATKPNEGGPTVYRRITDHVDTESRAYRDASLSEDAVLSNHLGKYFSFRAEEMKLGELLIDKTDPELQLIGQEHSKEVKPEAFNAVLVDTYFSVKLEEACVHHRFQVTQIMGEVTESGAEERARDVERSVGDLKAYLSCRQDDIKALFSSKDLAEIIKEQARVVEEIEAQRTPVLMRVAEYEAHIQETRNKLKKQRSLTSSENPRIITALVDQPVNVFHKNVKGENALYLALQCENPFEVAKMILDYAKSTRQNLKKLFLETHAKIKECKNKQFFLFLIGNVYLFDSALAHYLIDEWADLRRVCVYTPTCSEDSVLSYAPDLSSEDLTKIAGEVLTRVDDKMLAVFIQNSGHNVWPHNVENGWQQVHAEVRQRYIDSDREIPDVVWQALQKKQKLHERFEKLVLFFEDAITHVVEKYYNPAVSEIYAGKIVSLLNHLYHAAKDAAPLEEEVEKVANALTMPLSGISPCAPGIDFHGKNKTQRLIQGAVEPLFFRQTRYSILQDQDLAESSEVDVKQDIIRKVLDKMEGAAKEQEERQKKVALTQVTTKLLRKSDLFPCCSKSSPSTEEIARQAAELYERCFNYEGP